MTTFNYRWYRLTALLVVILLALASTTSATLARPASAATTVTFTTTGDAGTIKSVPTFIAPNVYMVLSKRANGDFDNNFIQFNLAAIPLNATITSAVLHLNFFAAGGPVDVATGRVNAAWNEATINWNNQPGITWNGPVRTVSALGDATWPVTTLVQNWQNGIVPNYGFALRGTTGTGAALLADSAETGIAPTLVVTYTRPTAEPRDLGDAPDSSNHAGAGMTAYPAVPARYPTVFDPATGLPQGPLHATPRPFHLGPQVSREAEADVGPDEDPTNNIRPAVNVPNLDRYDDGANPNAWPLTNCVRVVLPIQVFISPQAVNWFQQHNNAKGDINIWLDSNRDGDWADPFTCHDSQGVGHPSVEHIVIDAPVNVVGLGAGLHVVPVTTGYVTYPAALAQRPSWVRVTLSERVSSKPLTYGTIKYGDGRGYSTPFTTGETEDYLRGQH